MYRLNRLSIKCWGLKSLLRLVVAMLAPAAMIAPLATASYGSDGATLIRIEYCKYWQDFSQLTMAMRQDGFSVFVTSDYMLQRLAQDGHDRDTATELAKLIIQHAFTWPMERSERGAHVATVGFGEDTLRNCLSRR